ncbi:hypothetical protein [Streptomyces sp. NPDC005322]|uniref:hypothetical protein n=1 Tax=unclassified Streptomyces TaxID=2593676 RepID=UPI0033A655D6
MIDAPSFMKPVNTAELTSLAPDAGTAGHLPGPQDDLVIEELTDASRAAAAPRACICICTTSSD